MAMTQYGTWVSYSGVARIELAIILLAAAGGLVYSGLRLPRPFQAARVGRRAMALMLAAWVLSIAAFLVCLAIYAVHSRHEYRGISGAPANHITPVTVIAAGLTFFIISLLDSSHGPWTRLTSAAIGAMAAPMIFELPFDLIVMTRTYPPPPSGSRALPDPVLPAAVPHRDHYVVAARDVSDGEAVPGSAAVSRVDARGFRGLEPLRFRLPVRPDPHRAEHGVEDPGLRDSALPDPAAPNQGQHSRPKPRRVRTGQTQPGAPDRL